ncbi:Sm-like protein lsm7 [Paramecium bursaria]
MNQTKDGHQHLPKESIIKLAPHMEKVVIVHFQGGRKVQGTLKSFDQNMNLILDDSIEFLRDSDDSYTYNNGLQRQLGIVIARGTLINYILSKDGLETIENPFVQQE